jgi:myo-inositol-1(or 4)-monophosphatase
MSSSSNSLELLERIHAAREAARAVLNRFTPGAIGAEYKVGHDPVTEADRDVDDVLRQTLLRAGEGWLSEETVDDFTRLDKQRVWVVDPLDGTREFVHGIPEFFVSMVTSTSSPKVSWDYTEHAPHYDKRADYSCDAIKNC